MKGKAGVFWILAGCLVAAAAGVTAQSRKLDTQPPAQTNVPQQAPQTQPNGNPFPEDEGSVPVIPSGNEPAAVDDYHLADSPDAAPPRDSDPVRSPEGAAPGDSGATEGFSSSRNGLDNLVPDPDTETPVKPGKKGDDQTKATPVESAEKDVDVGNYYMDRKDWRGALSRFQSALVLAPDNPDVYWGLAECERHLGQFAEARANYAKVAEYDPESKHGKDATKALKDPDLAKAAPAQK
jgi:tetratricopeptide (TPR) repeat protein